MVIFSTLFNCNFNFFYTNKTVLALGCATFHSLYIMLPVTAHIHMTQCFPCVLMSPQNAQMSWVSSHTENISFWVGFRQVVLKPYRLCRMHRSFFYLHDSCGIFPFLSSDYSFFLLADFQILVVRWGHHDYWCTSFCACGSLFLMILEIEEITADFNGAWDFEEAASECLSVWDVIKPESGKNAWIQWEQACSTTTIYYYFSILRR